MFGTLPDPTCDRRSRDDSPVLFVLCTFILIVFPELRLFICKQCPNAASSSRETNHNAASRRICAPAACVQRLECSRGRRRSHTCLHQLQPLREGTVRRDTHRRNSCKACDDACDGTSDPACNLAGWSNGVCAP